MQPPSLTVPVVNTLKWGWKHQLFYACLGAWLLAVMANLALAHSLLMWQCLGILLVLLFLVKQVIGDPYTITGHLTFEAWQLTAEWPDNSFMVFTLQDLEQIRVLIEAAENDRSSGRNGPLSAARGYYRSGLTNVLEFYENGKLYKFQFRLRDVDMDPLNACLLYWVRGQYDVRIDDYSGRGIPHRMDQPS